MTRTVIHHPSFSYDTPENEKYALIRSYHDELPGEVMLTRLKRPYTEEQLVDAVSKNVDHLHAAVAKRAKVNG